MILCLSGCLLSVVSGCTTERASVIRDLEVTTQRPPILDIIHFASLREVDARRWSGNEFHREVISSDPQKLIIVNAKGTTLEYVLDKGSFYALLFDHPGYVGVQGTGIAPASLD